MEATEHTLYETYTDFASMYKTLKTVNSLAKTEFVVQHAQQALQAHGREVQRVQNNKIQQRGCSKPDWYTSDSKERQNEVLKIEFSIFIFIILSSLCCV